MFFMYAIVLAAFTPDSSRFVCPGKCGLGAWWAC